MPRASLSRFWRLARVVFQGRVMKIRIDRPTFVRLNLQAGDELSVARMTPELQTLLDSAGVDNNKHAHLVTDEDADELAVVGRDGETATTGRGRREPRAATLPR